MKCPNCGHEQPDGAAECASCQIFFEKWRKMHEPQAAAAGQPAPPKQPPYFHGLMTSRSMLQVNQLYRVYVRPEELVFIWAASGGKGEELIAEELSITRIFGLHKSTSEEENASRRAVMDSLSLERLLPDNELNFRAALSDISEASLEPPSSWLRYMYAQVEQAAVFNFRHREKGKFRLCLRSGEELRAARPLLCGFLGGRLLLNV